MGKLRILLAAGFLTFRNCREQVMSSEMVGAEARGEPDGKVLTFDEYIQAQRVICHWEGHIMSSSCHQIGVCGVSICLNPIAGQNTV